MDYIKLHLVPIEQILLLCYIDLNELQILCPKHEQYLDVGHQRKVYR